MQRRVVFHIDVNSAFVSWSAVKILSEGGQDIRLVPSVVSGDPSDRRSIVAAKRSVRAGRNLFFSRTVQDDGTDCFSVMDGEGKVIEKHTVLKLLK